MNLISVVPTMIDNGGALAGKIVGGIIPIIAITAVVVGLILWAKRRHNVLKVL